MICYRDRAYCTRECGNLECSRNQKTIDQASFERVGLPLSVMDMRTEKCGFVEPGKEKSHAE